MSKPPLESRILELYNRSGKKTDFVILLSANGHQIGGLYDLKDENSKKALQYAYDIEYETSDERSERYSKQSREIEDKRFANARQVNEADFYNDRSRVGGVWWGDEYFDEIEDLIDRLESDGVPREDYPKFVWGSKLIDIRHTCAEDIWADISERLAFEDPDTLKDPDPQSVIALNKALEDFYSANSSKLIAYEPDHKYAILITYLNET